MPLTPGDRLGPYEIVSPIGAGGMGEVYKARDQRLDRLVALKVSKAEFTERFSREARTVAQLNHPYSRFRVRCRWRKRWNTRGRFWMLSTRLTAKASYIAI